MNQNNSLWTCFSLRFLSGIVTGVLIASFSSQIAHLAHQQTDAGNFVAVKAAAVPLPLTSVHAGEKGFSLVAMPITDRRRTPIV